MMQRLHLDRTSSVDPLALLENLSLNGITQDACINDLGWLIKDNTKTRFFIFTLIVAAYCFSIFQRHLLLKFCHL